MNNQRLPTYPEHAEPTFAVDSSEYERESKPRRSPASLVWMGLALIVGLVVLQQGIARFAQQDQPVATRSLAPRVN